MAFTEFYCNASTGSNLNAGSTTGAASFTYASGSWVASTGVFTVASGNPSSDGVAVGDFASVYADGSTVTGFVGRVTARDTTTITVSLTAKSGTAPTDGTNTRTLKIGGVWKGPNGTEAFPIGFCDEAMVNASGDFYRVNFKDTATYTITAAMTHAKTGPGHWAGYTTSPGDGGKVTVDGGTSGASYILLTVSAATTRWASFIFQNNGATGTADGVVFTGEASFVASVVHDIRGDGLFLNVGSFAAEAVECEVYACNKAGTSGDGGFRIVNGSLRRCISHDNTGSTTVGYTVGGFNSRTEIINCIADSNGGAGLVGVSQTNVRLSGFEAYNNGSHGISIVSGSAGSFPSIVSIENSNFVKNGGYGITSDGNDALVTVRQCGFGAGTQANSSGQTNNLGKQLVEGSVTYANDAIPWVDPANGDFRITLAAAKGAGRGTFTQTAASYAGTIGYPDIGAAQHQDAGGSASGVRNPLRGPLG